MDMPKLECPFERAVVGGRYICIPVIKPEYMWAFTEEIIAVEKLVHFVDGRKI
jgi:hypothetical protein